MRTLPFKCVPRGTEEVIAARMDESRAPKSAKGWSSRIAIWRHRARTHLSLAISCGWRAAHASHPQTTPATTMADILVAQPVPHANLFTCISCTIAFHTAQDQSQSCSLTPSRSVF